MPLSSVFPLNQHHHPDGFRGLVWRYIWGPINLVLSFLPLAWLNLFQLIGLMIYPFSKNLFRRYQRLAAFMIWGWWGFAAQKICGLRLEVTGDSISEKENAIVICNHQGMADVIIILCQAFNVGTITRSTWMAKDVLKYVPGLGWGMAFLDTVFLKRNWARDEKGIKATFSNIVKNNVPIWMIMFPEGTRLTSEKLAKSQEFARKRSMIPLKNLLTPRTMGFVATVSGLREHVTAVYSFTIGYHGRVPSLTEIIRGDVKKIGLHIKRIPIAEIPHEQDQGAKWLLEEYSAMDSLLASFRSQGRFPAS